MVHETNGRVIANRIVHFAALVGSDDPFNRVARKDGDYSPICQPTCQQGHAESNEVEVVADVDAQLLN